MENGGNGVLVRFSNGSESEGDILVGADGAYSAIRQSLYAKLKKAKKLRASDDLPLPFSTVCLVGQTRPLTPEEFPDIALDESQFRNILGDNKPYSVSSSSYDALFIQVVFTTRLTTFLFPPLCTHLFVLASVVYLDDLAEYSMFWCCSLPRYTVKQGKRCLS